MQEGIFVEQSAEERRLQDWLFNPFRYVAGPVALLIGLAAIAASAFFCYISSTHFDGILEVHFGNPAPFGFFLAEGLVAWLCMALTLQVYGAILAPAPFRFIDMLGTQAMARWPYLFVALVSLPRGVRTTMQYMNESVTKTPHTVTLSAGGIAVTAFAFIVAIAAIIWMVTLMYKGYSISTGIRQTRRRVISFIVALILSSIISKVIIIVMAVKAGIA